MATWPASQFADEDVLSWMDTALCRGLDVNIFFCSPADEDDVAYAKSFCQRCPVRQDCLEYALATQSRGSATDDLGVWGGLTHSERNTYVRARQRLNLKMRRMGHG